MKIIVNECEPERATVIVEFESNERLVLNLTEAAARQRRHWRVGLRWQRRPSVRHSWGEGNVNIHVGHGTLDVLRGEVRGG